MGITPCIPGRKSREKPVKYDKRRYKRRNRIEIMFGRLKDWRACRNPLRQMSKGIPVSHRSRCNRFILVMSPEPKKSGLHVYFPAP